MYQPGLDTRIRRGDLGVLSTSIKKLLVPENAKKLDIDLGEGYEVYIVSDRYNKLIKRREVEAVIIHIGKPTLSRMKLRYSFSKAFNVDTKVLYIRSIKTEYGMSRSRVTIHIYDTPELAQEFEPKYIIERNKLPEEEEEE